jgi:succinyl-diaminopimelate desuccinylase
MTPRKSQTMEAVDAVELSRKLIRCPSVTPKDEGALDLLATALETLGFHCHRLRFEEPGTAAVENLYARIGDAAPNFCFAGHTDVVPPGERKLWRFDPFAAEIHEGVLYGRGAADMKSSVAAFVAAAARCLAKGPLRGSISLLITGDEEGPAVNGTPKLLGWLKQRGERIDHCIVGEPTSQARPGDTLKIGRRGSVNFSILARGVQGHVGYPRAAKNPIPALATLVTRLSAYKLDDGTEHFEPSTLSFTSIDVGNPANNVIPAEARALCNIRFNDRHTAESLTQWARKEAAHVARDTGCEMEIASSVSGVAFLTKPGQFTELVSAAVKRTTNAAPAFSTSGGTSDARFIKNICPVVELGLAGATMHKSDECVPVADIHRLVDIYDGVLGDYFANPPE